MTTVAPLERADDHELVARARAGEQEAFGQLYVRHHDALLRASRARASADDAEDLVAEVFLRALAALPRYDERGHPFSALLFRIARNRATDAARAAHPTDALEEATGLEVEDDAVASAIASDERSRLEGMLADLSPLQQQVVRLRFFDDRSYEETARAIGRPVRAVRSLQHRALTALRRRSFRGR